MRTMGKARRIAVCESANAANVEKRAQLYIRERWVSTCLCVGNAENTSPRLPSSILHITRRDAQSLRLCVRKSMKLFEVQAHPLQIRRNILGPRYMLHVSNG